MTGRPDFVETYNAVQVPGVLQTIDAMSPEFAQAEQDFFDRIRASFALSSRALDMVVQPHYHNMVVLFEDPVSGYNPLQPEAIRPTESYIETLDIEDVQTIASVIRTRNAFNHQVAVFAKYPLSDRAITIVRELQMGEDIIHGLPLSTD